MSPAFNKFRQAEPTRLEYEDGDYTAVAFISFGAWTWVAFRKGKAIAGRRDWKKLDAYTACAEALECIELEKAAPSVA